ncbi:hypothetical protein BJ165DRAFT_1513742 [Panaeolus papilionaceus]|nr:hypothetical protein BJ165DRAFT_1513742 [Panaeolus papilionaceus]
MSNAIDDEYQDTTLSEPVFPLEIFQLVIANLASSLCSSADVRACALVCKAFLPLCRPFLFQGLEFGPIGTPNKNQHRLRELLNTNPHLAQYFQDVTFSVNHHDMEEENTAMQEAFAQRPEPLYVLGPSPAEAYVDRIIAGGDPTLFYTLPNLKTLRIKHVDGLSAFGSGKDDPWDDECDPAIVRVLKAHSFSQTLTTLRIDGTGAIPMSLVMGIPNLRKLTLRECDCSNWTLPRYGTSSTAGDDALRHMLKLEILSVQYTSGFPVFTLAHCKALRSIHGYGPKLDHSIPDYLNLPGQSSSFNTLRTLHIGSLREWKFLWAMAEKPATVAFPELEDLSMTVKRKEEFPLVDTILHHVRALKSLEIKASVRAPDRGISSITQLHRCLDNCRASLTDISLEWQLHRFYEETYMRSLNDALAAVSGQNVIERIHIHLELYWSSEVERLGTPSFDEWRRFSALLVENKQRDFPMLRLVGVQQETLLFMASPGDPDYVEWGDKDFLWDPLELLRTNNVGVDLNFRGFHS